MSKETTAQALAAVTDEGLFEQLAMAILREANPMYANLVHTGVNLAGKTMKSPLDGICFVQGADSPHMIAVHHTITARNDLEKKWLQDPFTVKPRRGTNPTAPPGDVIKTAELVAKERKSLPGLRATLILTTNKEPAEALVRKVEESARSYGLEVDLWSSSRLCHFLDNQPIGQWIRRSFLNIKEELLSAELLHELSKKSLEVHRPQDDPSAWVSRLLDDTLLTNPQNDLTFIVAGSGLGKSVACYRLLAAYVNRGGLGIVLPDHVVATSETLEQAVRQTLHELYPSLAKLGSDPFAFCSPHEPLLLVVEDINRSGKTLLLIEKLARWSRTTMKEGMNEASSWRLLVPLWPEALAPLNDQTRKQIEPMLIMSGGFTGSEGREAVLARARLTHRDLTPLGAEEISRSLGDDPLLIALHDQRETADPNRVISQFVEGSISRTAAARMDHPASDYRTALRLLAGEMFKNRQIELTWSVVSSWSALQGDPLVLLAHLGHKGEILRFTSTSDNQRLLFRHDRVRDWLLVDAADELDCQDLLRDEVISDPYFSEVMGAVLVWGSPKPHFLQRVAYLNPLALFHALRLYGETVTHQKEELLQEINDWLDKPITHDPANNYLRWAALGMLAETSSPEVPGLVRRFHDRTISGQLARFRNGDLLGGIELCFNIEPGVTAPWRDVRIDHAKLRYGPLYSKELADVLEQKDLRGETRVGALRLAGHIGDPKLLSAIEACWGYDRERVDNLDEYLWAFGECCDNDPARYLGPVCDTWAELSDEPEKEGGSSPRNRVAAYNVHWAFRRWPPKFAVDFFVERGSREDLRRQLIHLLHGVDHPKAVVFVVHELAKLARRLEGSKSFSMFLFTAEEEWRRAQKESGRTMSVASRRVLYDIWQNESNEIHLRKQALSLWAATVDPGDLAVLRGAKPSQFLDEKVLWERLRRGDQQAIPAMMEKVTADDAGYWWQCGRQIWSDDLTGALDEALTKRSSRAKRVWNESAESDWIMAELIMSLPETQGERLLLKHWDHLRFSSYFVQAALFIASPALAKLVEVAIKECPEPATLLEHLSMHYGIRTNGRPGLTRKTQILTLKPYFDLLSPFDIKRLWDACNDQGWFSLRQELLDNHLQAPYARQIWNQDLAMSDLDGLIAQGLYARIPFWIDEFMKTGIPWVEILATMTRWFNERRSIQALRALADAVIHRGTREHLSVLNILEGMPEPAASQLIADTQYAVRRRSLR